MQKRIKLTPKQERLKRAIKPIVENILMESNNNVYPLKYISEKYYDKSAKLVKCGDYIYNVSSRVAIYDAASDVPVK